MDSKERGPNPQPSVEIVYAGGTISSLATAEGYREGGHEVDLIALLEERAPEFKAEFTVGQKAVAYTGLSENMDEEYWLQIDEKVSDALTRNPRGVVVTHGTDSMEQTARHLDQVFGDELGAKHARVILTGANDDIAADETDAWSNLQFALESSVEDIPPGVYVAFHGRLVPASEVVKLPFVDGEAGFISNQDPAYQEALERQAARTDELVNQLQESYPQPERPPHILRYDANIIVPDHQELLDYIESNEVDAILLTLYHSGTANTEKPGKSVAELVEKLRTEKGILFFGVTENGEPNDLHSYETSVRLREAGVVPLYDMPGGVAEAKLRLMDKSWSRQRVIDEMLTNRVGELDENRIYHDDVEQLKVLYA